MNKKEVIEIRKVCKVDNPYCILNRVVFSVVDAEANIRTTQNRSAALLTDRELDMYYKIFRQVISTKLCKKFVEYDFPNEAYEADGEQSKLYSLLTDNFNTDYIINEYVEHISNNLSYTGPYAVVMGHFTYSVAYRNAAGSDEKYRREDYNFVVCAICPVVFIDSGFAFDFSTNRLSTSTENHLYVKPTPTDGFMFPAFNDRSADVNSVMYYLSKPDSPNLSFIENVLGCKPQLSSVTETELFKQTLKNAFGEDLDFSLLYILNDMFSDMYDTFKDDTKPVMIDADAIAELLASTKCDPEKIARFKTIYGITFDSDLHLLNLIDNKIKLQTSEYSVSFSPAVGIEKIRTAIEDGQRAIKLSTDDAQVDVNGLSIEI